MCCIVSAFFQQQKCTIITPYILKKNVIHLKYVYLVDFVYYLVHKLVT